MSRIPKIERDAAPPAVHAIYDGFFRERGNVPNMMKTMARRPRHLVTMVEHMKAVLSAGTVPTKLKELIAVQVSKLNGCDY